MHQLKWKPEEDKYMKRRNEAHVVLVLLLCTAARGCSGVRGCLAGSKFGQDGFKSFYDAGEGRPSHVVGCPALVEQHSQILHALQIATEDMHIHVYLGPL
jgi:hypothetical protein